PRDRGSGGAGACGVGAGATPALRLSRLAPLPQEGSGGLGGNRGVGVGERVLAVDVDQGRLELRQFRLVQRGVGADDHQVARLRAVRGGAVHRDDAAALFRADRVGDETLAVVDVEDVHLFVFADAGNVEQAAVDGAGAFVMQL